MKARKFFATALMSLIALVAAAGGNAKGSNMKNPDTSLSVNGSKTITLVDEYDPELKENWGSGVYYMRVQLQRGQEYTIWINGGATSEMAFSVDTDFEDESAPMAWFEYDDKDSMSTQIAYMYADAWDEEDPAKGYYYIWISGDIGAQTTIHFASGIRSFAQEGEEGSPRRVTVTEAIQRETRTQLDMGDYYYTVHLEAGRKYRLWWVGSSAPVSIVTEQTADIMPMLDPLYSTYFASQFPGYSSNNGVGYVVFPSVTQDYTFDVYSPTGAQPFGFLYQAFAKRLPKDHPNLVTLVDDKKNPYSADVVPGRIVADGTYYYDDVIDETLCRIAVSKNERWVFQTEGASKEILMRVYDEAGNILAENKTLDGKSNDVRSVMRADYDGWYYVGVCDPWLTDITNKVETTSTVRVFARKADDFNVSGRDYDKFDHLDDDYTGATLITPYPGASSNLVLEVGSVQGPHVLSGGDWYDWFKFAGRKYLTYRLKASFAGTERSDLKLTGMVYKMVNGVVKPVTNVAGMLTPYEADEGTAPLTFTADEDAMYYVGVCVGNSDTVGKGLGLDYPSYNIHAMAFIAGFDLGLMQVNTLGVDGAWTFEDQLTGRSTVRYDNGATYCVIADKINRVWFENMSGYTTPAASIQADGLCRKWTGNPSDITVVNGIYTDNGDPKDDASTSAAILSGGYTLVNPVAEEGTLSRTLWRSDLRDNVVFRAQTGRYYSFELVDRKDLSGSTEKGDAVFAVYSQNDFDTPLPGMEGLTKLSKQQFTPGVYYVVKVYHGSPVGSEMDTCYDLKHKAVNVGNIQFSPASAVVTKNDAYAELTVTRSASEGAVSVMYGTIEGTAKPKIDYFPTSRSGVLSWENGDATPRTIRIPLVPDMTAKWEAAKQFQVKIWPFAEDTLGDDEYRALLGADTATVTINSAVEKNPGTVALLDQPLQLQAGEPSARIRVSRSGGTNGRVAVALYLTPGTAVAGVDYSAWNPYYQIVEWADGEGGDRAVEIQTFDKVSLASKTLTVSMMALQADYRSLGYGDYRDCLLPKLGSTSSLLTLTSTAARQTGGVLAEAAKAGVSLSTPIGSWYVDGSDHLRSAEVAAGAAARVGFTVTGPGFFMIEPQIRNGSSGDSMIYLAPGGTVQDCTNPDGPLVLSVPAGAQTILFQINSATAGAYADFGLQDNGQPFKWMPLSSMTAKPMSGSVIRQDEVGTLSWTAPEGAGSLDVWYRVKIGLSAESMAYEGVTKTLGTTGSIEPSLLSTMNSIVNGLSLGKSQRFWWRVECAYCGTGEPTASTVWMSAPNAWFFDMLYKGSPSTLVSGTDVTGATIIPGATIQLIEGVPFEAALSADNYDALLNISGCVGGTLPPGFSAAGKKISGVPSKAGDYTALVEVGGNGYFASTTEVKFHVASMGGAAGSFTGVLQEDGTANPNAFLRNLGLQVTTTPEGLISASVLYNGGRLAFSSNEGFTDYNAETGEYGVTLSMGKNTLELTLRGIDTEDPEQLGTSVGRAKFTLFLPDEYTYACELTRDNSASELFTDTMKSFAGYYTVAFKPVGPVSGEPAGNGLLVISLAESGQVSMTGILADGAMFTCTSFANLIGDPTDPASCIAKIPVWAFGANYSLGGVLGIRIDEKEVDGETFNAAYVDSYYQDSCSRLEWTKDGAGSTFDGYGFRLGLSPVGGWYDKVVNLRRYYLDCDFTVETEPIIGLSPDVLPKGISYMIDTTPHGVGVDLNGSSISVKPTTFAFEAGSKRFDLASSVNPWGVTCSFARASGLVTGSFNVISDDGVSQGYAAKCEHRGLVLMNRDPKAPLDVDVWSAGFYLLPFDAKWTQSQPFNIRAQFVDRDWSEAEIQQ